MLKSLLCLSFISVLSVTASAKKNPIFNKVVYGHDNRLELNRSSFSPLRNSVAAMISSYSLRENTEKDTFDILSFSTLERYRGKPTCDEMRFRDQPRVANCTGFLINEDTLVTAGHCMINYGTTVTNMETRNCRNNSWVFDYSQDTKGNTSLSFPKDNVYECDKVISAQYTNTVDYAIVKLKRKTVNKTPLKLATSQNKYEKGTQVLVVGHPTGLPVKVAAGASIQEDATESQFVANLDTFAGNSGSPVLNFFGEAIGILVSGEIDYYLDKKRGCYTVNKCLAYNSLCNVSAMPLASGETVTKIDVVQAALEQAKEDEFKQEQESTVEIIQEQLELDLDLSPEIELEEFFSRTTQINK